MSSSTSSSNSLDSSNALLFILASLCIRSYTLVQMNSQYEEAYWNERRGRNRVEKEIRKLIDVQLNTSEGFFVQSIGIISSCYRQVVGTPRQGLLVPSSRATIKLTNNMSPEAMDGLEEFSHVWLTFRFHMNTNSLKNAKAFNGTITNDESSSNRNNIKRTYTFAAKITPPMLKERKGVLATRSPHRPNPLGVTLARIEKVDKKNRCLVVSACDLVEGTPVLDIKPYVPAYDTVPDYRIPDWITETIDTRNTVIMSPLAVDKVGSMKKKLKQYKNDPDLFIKALIETLEADVRSKFQTKRRILDASNNVTVDVPFDSTIVRYLWKEERLLEVVDVMLKTDLVELAIEREKLNSDVVDAIEDVDSEISNQED